MRPPLSLEPISHDIWEVAKWCVAWQCFALLWSSQASSTAEAEWIQRWVGCLSWCNIVCLKVWKVLRGKKALKRGVQMTDRSNDRPGALGDIQTGQNSERILVLISDFQKPLYPTYDRFSRKDVLVEPRWILIGKAWKTCFCICHSNTKKSFEYHAHVTFFLEFCWCTHVFSLFQPSGSCKFFGFEYYTSNSNSKDGASRHHHRAVARRIFKTVLLNLAQGSQKGASDFHCEIRNPDILRGWLHWWILWKILLRSGVRRMKNLPTTETFWILRHSICTTPLSGSLNQLP